MFSAWTMLVSGANNIPLDEDEHLEQLTHSLYLYGGLVFDAAVLRAHQVPIQ
jgi:hypothetical protein